MTALPRALVDRLAVWNALLALTDAPIPLGPRTSLALAVLPHGSPPPPATALHWQVQTAQGTLALALLDAPVPALTGAELALDQIATLPDPLPGMLRDTLAGAILGLLPPAAQQSILGLTPGMAPAATGPVERIRLTVEGGWGAPALLELAAPLAVLTGLAAGMAPAADPPQLPGPLAALIPATLRLALPGPTLRAARIQTLEPGDALMLPEPGALRLMAPGLVAALAPAGADWIVKEIAVTAAPDLPATDPDATPADGPGDIPVHLSFVIDTRRATLAEVQALRPGAVLALPVPAVAPGLPVRILANGREIGAGNLIEADGQPAVRLSTLFGQG